MAAYAALVSVMNTIDTLQLHPNPPISLDIKQVESLTGKVSFLQEFLETYNPQLPYTYSTEADPLESRIVDAAYAAEDAIESHVVDQITSDGGNITSDAMYEALEKVIEDMALIQKAAMEIKLENVGVQHQQHNKSTPLGSLRSYSIAESSMVGADDVKLQMVDELINGSRDRQIIPIVGMGGSGKTTLARNVYEERLIKEHFDVCAWATISQEYSIREILSQVLSQSNINEVGQHLSEDELGQKLYKHLYGRRYLIIMDDMWSIHPWDRVRMFLPDNRIGSRIVVTTRLSNLASQLSYSKGIGMSLLNEDDSWALLSKTVFGKEGCPLELEAIGKRIAKSCGGLPLSIVVVGGLLAKSEHTREYWENVEANLNGILGDDERYSKILHMSYKRLPIYLKPCFLYMGVFPKKKEIRISELIKLWVAEGFFKAISGRSLEDTAKEFLEDLIGRNLVMIHKTGSSGNVKYCKVHDLMRDICLRVAQKERFYTLTPQGMQVNAAQRRIVISKNEDINALSSMSLVRSLRWDARQALPPLSLRLLRILDSRRFQGTADVEFLENVHELVNSRFISLLAQSSKCKFPSSIWLFWNLQTIIANGFWKEIIVPADIWYMPHIRHVEVSKLYLPDPPNSQNEIVLRNLQTLGDVMDFKCSEEVVKRIPNIKKLKISYYEMLDDDKYCLSNLDRLSKLESLTCHHRHLKNQINFPHSLTKLTLSGSLQYCWQQDQDVLDKIGRLPHLESFKLLSMRFKDGQWETIEGQFCNLKFLALCECENFHVWTTTSSHLPRLEHLLLYHLDELREIPLDFAEIPTLEVIEVEWCSTSAVISAKRISEEHEDYNGEGALEVRVKVSRKNKAALEMLASPYFRIM